MSVNAQSSATVYRWAGILYLVVFVFGIVSETVLRAPVIVSGDAEATAANILGSQGLFYLSIAADLAMVLSDVALAILLFAIFRPVNQTLAMVAAGFRLTQSAILGLNLLNLFAGAMLVMHPSALGGFTAEQANSLALMFIDLHGAGYDLGLFFFAIACLVLGRLVAISGFAPKALGYLVVASGVVYFTGSGAVFFAPDWQDTISYFYIVPVIAEAWFALWLLFKGFGGSLTRPAVA